MNAIQKQLAVIRDDLLPFANMPLEMWAHVSDSSNELIDRQIEQAQTLLYALDLVNDSRQDVATVDLSKGLARTSGNTPAKYKDLLYGYRESNKAALEQIERARGQKEYGFMVTPYKLPQYNQLELMGTLAYKLTGQAIDIEVNDLVGRSDAAAYTWYDRKAEKYKIAIDTGIYNGLAAKFNMLVFLHEVAHARLHRDYINGTASKAGMENALEYAADNQAAQWYDVGEGNAGFYPLQADTRGEALAHAQLMAMVDLLN